MGCFDRLFEIIKDYIEEPQFEEEKKERLKSLKALAGLSAYHGILNRIGLEPSEKGWFLDPIDGKEYKFEPALANVGEIGAYNKIICGRYAQKSIPASMIDNFLDQYEEELEKVEIKIIPVRKEEKKEAVILA